MEEGCYREEEQTCQSGTTEEAPSYELQQGSFQLHNRGKVLHPESGAAWGQVSQSSWVLSILGDFQNFSR